ncbi:DUF624 domain-containing protein [Pseudonocardia kunmingensis]|uniref:Uncharacterized protein DUF624 n=1 Tax=Pseudonocardia kunmingensis TaxID=630975 RepID=A0A543D1B9_9PSEU|nr:DUF624 domain-containing protein [Pseudonocardia kunmingensis]TQM03092.1 uncharacterized protein DUF624 [Pseudonocardia kunmingensis]
MTRAQPDERHSRRLGSDESAVRPRGTGWEGVVLRCLEFVAYPALAGVAFCLLCLGVVTWLPALAAVAAALQRWRHDGDSRCFTGVFAAFPGCWRALWRHALLSTAVLAALVVAVAFLAGRPEPLAIPLLAVQAGGLAAFAVYHLAVAVVTGAAPEAPARRWALVLAFGSRGRGLALLAAVVLSPLVTLPLAVGPLLLGPTLPVLVGLVLLDRARVASGSHPDERHSRRP